MKITIRGEMHFRQIIQALFEALSQIELDHAIRHSRGVTLYINPTDGLGKDVVARRNGEEVREVSMKGPYRSAADEFNI